MPLGSRAFRFFNAWCDRPKLHSVVKKELEDSSGRDTTF